MRKTSELFLLFNTGVDFSLRNNFANSGSFAKVSVPVHTYNSLAELTRVKVAQKEDERAMSWCCLLMSENKR